MYAELSLLKCIGKQTKKRHTNHDALLGLVLFDKIDCFLCCLKGRKTSIVVSVSVFVTISVAMQSAFRSCACNDKKVFFTSEDHYDKYDWTCQSVCDTLTFL